MKNKITATLIPALAAWLLTSALCLPTFAQGTAFTYQGRLNDGGNPAGGIYDLRFALYDAASVGTQQGGTVDVPDAPVTNGLFTVTLDFGDGVFTGAARWLDIAVRPGASVGTFTNLVPRQKLTPTPYAITAGNLNGALSSANLSGTYGNGVTLNNGANSFSGNGAGLNNLNADLLGGLGAASFWIVGGNASSGGASLGNGDNQPLNLISWNSRVLRLETRKVSLGLFDSLIAVNTLGGAAGNVISNGVMGGTIAGGGAETNHLFSSEPAPNTVLDNFGTVGGGLNNTAGYASTNFDDARSATVAGGEDNTASGPATTVGGGNFNTASGFLAATVGGGVYNTSSDYAATVGGGGYNLSSGLFATVPGGLGNQAAGYNSFAAGDQAKALHDGCFVWSDVDESAPFAQSTGGNQFVIRASGGIQIWTNTSINFGTQTRQMLNLWSTNYGIGVQGYTMYFRTDAAAGINGFSWYKGGVHNDDYANAGGGVELMHLIDGGLYVHGTFNNTSDRNAKENFASVVPADVLGKVIALPITRWNYKHDPATPHLGPVAQDFHAAFGVGPDDKHIATVDESGVALAAIQGLNQKVDSETATLRAENAELKQRLEKLEQLMNHKNGGAK